MESTPKTPLEELLSEDSPEGYCKTLSSFYSAWISSEHSNGTSPDERSLALTHFKAMRRFLFRIRQEQKPKKKKAEKQLAWMT